MTDEDVRLPDRAPEPDPEELLRARKKRLAERLTKRGLIKSDDPQPRQEPRSTEGA